MKITLTIGERIATSSVLRSKESDDHLVLLDYRKLGKQFELSDEEKERINFRLEQTGNNRVATTWDKQHNKDTFEFEVDVDLAKKFVEQAKELMKKKAINASDENVLAVFEKMLEVQNTATNDKKE